jgi:hypothetical protein
MIFGTFAGKIRKFVCSFIWIFLLQLALASGVAMPIMMWLFQSVINSLVDIGTGNATKSANWYIDKDHILFSFDPCLVMLIQHQLVIHSPQLKVLSNGMQR